GANKNSIKIIGDKTDKYVQAYFQYDSKKTGGVTISHLRFGDTPIKSPYYITKANFVACHNPSYMVKGYDIVQDVKPGGTFLLNCQWTPEEIEANLPAKAKKYIAENNIQFYVVNAIDKAREIGMGKRTNTILQSAFFVLAKILPIEQAIEYMKAYAKKSYLKKGEAVVELNYKAIDAGADALVKVEVPECWKNASDDTVAAEVKGDREELVRFVKEVVLPVGKMGGDKLPVSKFVEYADGTVPQGSAAYEKRGVAVDVPVWHAENCIQCNSCAFVCPHATIRPFALNADEVANAPAVTKYTEKPVIKTDYKFTMAISPLDCMGCTLCVKACPVNAKGEKDGSGKKALEMVPQATQLEQQAAFDYCVANVSEKRELINTTVKGSQFKQPLLEFSGSCAGCAETAYARLVTQLFGDRMYISNATGCSSIWGGPGATSPYCTNKEGHGPAWSNSLFADNAEHGLGMYTAQKFIREGLIEKVKAVMEATASEERKAACAKYLETVNDGEANKAATAALVANLEANVCCDTVKEILENKEYLCKKSVWIFGGDGWAYDIGFGGVDHVLASNEDVNIFVFDTEVYSNTGGQASKASNIGQVAQFAAAGKEVKKKSLAEIAMSYGYVYVAQIAMGANPAQTIKAIAEAEAYNGPSLIIGYAPCEMHSIKGGMMHCQDEMKKAVDCGYWNMFRFDPSKETGKFTLDSKAPKDGYQDFLKNEARYSRLIREFPDRADELFARNEAAAKERYEHLLKLVELYKD
ncbi:MAG: pyruvate:ferredoxin (flavodoxin) oxidoreductase, partial [Oscillospiraceae bacterium]|nr:pyruvate:ferredoxin (flavodoxin) oxidoreductase [Oscillospiraceae bacterium]